MIEIKFRVWDSVQKQMYTGQRDAPLYIFEELGIHRYPDTDPYTDQYVVMQFTGLRDKNGEEIYQGGHCKRYRRKYSSRSNMAKFPHFTAFVAGQ
jgi:hypothetical protein